MSLQLKLALSDLQPLGLLLGAVSPGCTCISGRGLALPVGTIPSRETRYSLKKAPACSFSHHPEDQTQISGVATHLL